MAPMLTNSTPHTPTAQGQPRAGEQRQLVTFEVGGEEFAVDILLVKEINRMMELTRVPQAPSEVEGVINLRGKIIPVVDLRKRFNMPGAERTNQNRIVVVEVGKRALGFIVDRVNQPLYLDESKVDPAPAMVCSVDSEFIAGVGKLENRLIILLDLSKLFRAEALEQINQTA